jgi:hypothetical protein
MRNVTVTLDERTARWARRFAALQGKSMSRVIGEILSEKMERETGYESAMRGFLERRPTVLSDPGEPCPDREERNARGRLR